MILLISNYIFNDELEKNIKADQNQGLRSENFLITSFNFEISLINFAKSRGNFNCIVVSRGILSVSESVDHTTHVWVSLKSVQYNSDHMTKYQCSKRPT